VRRAFDVVLLLAAIVALWQALHELAPIALSSPHETVAKLARMSQSERFRGHLAETGQAFALALAISTAGGVVFGVTLGLNRLGAQVADPILVSIYSLPKVTLYPVILLVFGLGMSAKVAFGALHGIIPIALFSMNAVRNVAPVYLKTARVLRLGYGESFRTVIVPAALPEIVSGVRIGFSLTLLGVLIGEMFASQRGLGFLLMNAIGRHDVETMMAVILLLATFATIANALLLWIDRRLHVRAAEAL
jgi:NitT/TauT family transport system permease protein